MRSSVTLNLEKDHNYRILWSILSYIHPCENSDVYGVSIYKHYYFEINIDRFECSIGFELAMHISLRN